MDIGLSQYMLVYLIKCVCGVMATYWTPNPVLGGRSLPDVLERR